MSLLFLSGFKIQSHLVIHCEHLNIGLLISYFRQLQYTTVYNLFININITNGNKNTSNSILINFL